MRITEYLRLKGLRGSLGGVEPDKKRAYLAKQAARQARSIV